MNAINFEYSLKKIPRDIKTQIQTLKYKLMDKVERFLRKIRWKAYFHENFGDDSDQNNENYGFK